MATTTSPLQEKLALFWHSHFATENDKVEDMLLMYRQNALFRSAGAGNFRDLVHSMSLQPAMLIYLDNDPNVVGQPNENFARELMELFTLGVDQYTQFDVEASARAWTGFNTLDSDREQFHFYPSRHDDTMKTFMGVTRDFDGPGIIDFILSENTVKKMTAAQFIATGTVDVLRLPVARQHPARRTHAGVLRLRPRPRRAARARSSCAPSSTPRPR